MITDWIEFGQVSAERDEKLSEYFFENGVLQTVIKNRHHFLVLGRKGAGKTAVFQHLASNSDKYLGPNDLLVSLSLQDYSWDIHRLLNSDGKASSLAYIQSWKYLIYLMALKRLIEQGATGKKLKGARRVIEKIYTSPTPTLGQIIGQKLLQLVKLKLPSGGLDLEGLDIDSISLDGGEGNYLVDVPKADSYRWQPTGRHLQKRMELRSRPI